MAVRNNRPQRSALSAALMSALVLTASAAMAQETPAPAEDKATELDKVVVTGSLIPQSELETFAPVTIISAEDLQTRGFNNVQEALATASMATGGVQGNQTSASFTQGAETNSLFGLPPGYIKYLIDGRPMANYPALYNGSDVFNNVSGIPIDMVDRIEILPGGQSSLYGSDAIAGVINVILKKRLDGAVVSARIGWFDEGGGQSGRISIADNFTFADDRANVLVGAQYEHRDPIWGFQRDITRQFYQHPYDNLDTPYNEGVPVASRDWLVFGAFGSYYFMDPNNCANVSDAFGGTTGLQERPNRPAPYCGSQYTPGYRTLKNGKESTQFYTHGTFDLNDNVQFYADVLLNKESVQYHVGSNYTWWGSSAKWGYFYDPNLDDFIQLQRAFAPEDMASGWEQSMNKDDSESYSVSLGVNGTFGESSWDYDLGFTRTHYSLTENGWNRLNDPINDWFEQNVMGPALTDGAGNPLTDPYGYGYLVYTPDYEAFYHLLEPGVFESFTTVTHSKSRTYDNMVRGQVTNGALFELPGGDAGIAIAAEWGRQGWKYTPDALLVQDANGDSEIWGTTSVAGSGERDRYAVTGELRLPVWDPLTISLSGRYDAFKAAGRTIDKPTYSVGLEFRPVESLLFRGKLGTAFRAPTLADMFQGLSGFYSSTADYLRCYSEEGVLPGDIDDCSLPNAQYFGQQEGNTELDPINADVWSAGVVWAPTPKFSVSADYHHWNIEDEVTTQSVAGLLRDELSCTPVDEGGLGTLDPTSGTCLAAFNQITRGGLNNTLQQIYITKINVSERELNAVTVELNYLQEIGAWGDLAFNGSWTRNVDHKLRVYDFEDERDLVNNPWYGTDPDYKANASVGWHKGDFTTTLFANYIGPTPNVIAFSNEDGYAADGAHDQGSYTTFNASVNFDATPDLRLSFLVTNLANRAPDQDLYYTGLSGEPFNSSNYDPYGRAFYLEARYTFGRD